VLVPLKNQQIKIRQAQKVEGVFKTGLDIVEYDYELNNQKQGAIHQISKLYENGKFSKQQMEDLIVH